MRSKLFFISLIILFVGCKRHSHPDKKIFRYNEVSGIATLDPAFAKNQSIMWVSHQLYNTLIEVDSNLNLVPSVAKSWTFSEDKKSITFIIRDSIYFHDDACFPNGKGRKLVAEDVAFSLRRIIDPATASPGAWIFNSSVDSLQPFTAPNDSTFLLRLRKPYQPILGILSMQYCSIIAREAVEKYGTEFRRHPVGTGPFTFVAWEEGQALILRKNSNYWEHDETGNRLPYLDGIKVNFFESRATEFLEFVQGRLDMVNDLDASFKDEVLSKTGHLKKDWEQKAILVKKPYLNTQYIGISMDSSNAEVKNSPLRQKQIRQALNYGIDREKIILYMRNSVGTPAYSGFVPAGMPSFDSAKLKGYRYDPQKARQLLAEAGYGPQNPVRGIKLLTIPTYSNLGTFAANEWKQLGIDVQVEVIRLSLMLEQTSKGQATFFRANWIADYPDAENYLGVFYGKNPAPPNYTRFKNREFDNLYEQALAETNDSLRHHLYRKMDAIILEEAPVIPVWYDMVLRLYQKNIEGIDVNSQNMLELRRVNKK